MGEYNWSLKGNDMSVDIPSEFLPFVQSSIASGRFESESAMVTAAFRLLAMRERELKLVQEGFDQIEHGDCIELDDEGLAKFFDDIMLKGRERLRAEGRTDV
jgi:putative addiction module CopG family antidote